jgi:hypothetical protein
MKQTRDRFNSVFLRLPSKSFFAAKRTDLVELKSLISSIAPINTETPLIRIGPTSDGGYLIPDDLDGIGSVFSPGVSTVSGFEYECAEKGMEVYLADASVDGPSLPHSRFHFLKKFLGSFTQGDLISMSDWVTLMQPDDSKDWLLQMDIEGAEYEVILNMPEKILRKYRIIIIEFHILDYLLDESFFRLAKCALNKLLLNHRCVHMHPNNSGGIMTAGDIIIPKIMEFTFHRNDRITQIDSPLTFPNPLDSANVLKYPELVLPEYWRA